MTAWGRFAAFNAVGCAGVVVQLVSLFVLTHVAGVHYMTATAAAVLVSVVHNFVWHRRWTWRDREGGFTVTLARYVLWNGTVSLVGNLGVTATLVAGTGISPVGANAVAIAVCGVVNFCLGDAVVFRSVRS